MMICVLLVTSGCAQKITGNYCDIAKPIYFPEALFDFKDRTLIKDLLENNENYFKLCK